jgi:hypothetical protein
VLADARHQFVDARQRLVVRVEVAVLPGQQEAALAALGIDEFGDQVAQVVLKLLRTDCLDVSSRRRWLPVSDAISTASVSMMPLTSSRCFARVGNAWPLRITG